MPNELNKLLSGFFQGGQNVAAGIFDRQDRINAQDEFNAYKTGLMNTYQQLMAQNQNILNGVTTPEGDIQQGNKSLNVNPLTDKLTEYDKLLGLQSNLAGNPYGEPFMKQAEGLYNTLFGKQTEPEKPQYREIYNKLIKINPDGTIEEVYSTGEQKKEKKTFTANELYGLGVDDVLNMNADEMNKYFDMLNPDVQAQLKSKYPQFNEVEKTRTGRRTGRRLPTKKDKKDDTFTDDMLDETEQPDNVSADLWADVKNAENKITEKYNKFTEDKKKGLQEERVKIAAELKQFEDEFASGQYTKDEMLEAINKYIAELEESNVDEDVLDEAFAYIKKRAWEMGISF